MNYSKTITEQLKENYAEIKHWLTYAESKNAILLGIYGTLFFKLDIQKYKSFEFVIAICLSIGVFILLNSFIPIIKLGKSSSNNHTNNPNNLFYSDIADYYLTSEKIEVDKYLENLKIDCYGNQEKIMFTQLDRSYAEEIIINSKITTHKFKSFKYSIFLLFLAFVLFITQKLLILFNLL